MLFYVKARMFYAIITELWGFNNTLLQVLEKNQRSARSEILDLIRDTPVILISTKQCFHHWIPVFMKQNSVACRESCET